MVFITTINNELEGTKHAATAVVDTRSFLCSIVMCPLDVAE